MRTSGGTESEDINLQELTKTEKPSELGVMSSSKGWVPLSHRAGELTRCLRALVIAAKDPSSTPSTYRKFKSHHLRGHQVQMRYTEEHAEQIFIHVKTVKIKNVKNNVKDQISLLNFRCQTGNCYLTKDTEIHLLAVRLLGKCTSTELVLADEMPRGKETRWKHFLQGEVIFIQYPSKLKDFPGPVTQTVRTWRQADELFLTDTGQCQSILHKHKLETQHSLLTVGFTSGLLDNPNLQCLSDNTSRNGHKPV